MLLRLRYYFHYHHLLYFPQMRPDLEWRDIAESAKKKAENNLLKKKLYFWNVFLLNHCHLALETACKWKDTNFSI